MKKIIKKKKSEKMYKISKNALKYSDNILNENKELLKKLAKL